MSCLQTASSKLCLLNMFVDRDTITTALEVDYNLSSQVSGFIIYTEALVFEIFARLIFSF